MSLFQTIKKLTKGDNIHICRVSDLLKEGVDPQQIMQGIIRINENVWNNLTDDSYIWTEDMLRSQFNICPELIFCGFENGKMVGTTSGFRSSEENLRKHASWLEKTGNGCYTHHVPDGDIFFGADLTVLRGASPGLSDRLLLAAVFCAIFGYGAKALYLGARIPGYIKHTHMNVEDYVYGKRKNGKPLDPELYFYCKNGFKIIEIIPGYMDDVKSLDYGVLIRWDNPIYKITHALPFLIPVIRFFANKLLLNSYPTNQNTHEKNSIFLSERP